MRLTLGGWLDHEEIFGLEGSGFALERLTNNFAAASDKTGNPPLYFPDFSATAAAERAVPIADPLRAFSGAVVANSSLRLWGAEGHGVVTLFHRPGLEVTHVHHAGNSSGVVDGAAALLYASPEAAKARGWKADQPPSGGPSSRRGRYAL